MLKRIAELVSRFRPESTKVTHEPTKSLLELEPTKEEKLALALLQERVSTVFSGLVRTEPMSLSLDPLGGVGEKRKMKAIKAGLSGSDLADSVWDNWQELASDPIKSKEKLYNIKISNGNVIEWWQPREQK